MVIWIFKTYFIIETNDKWNFLFLNPPPPMKREVALSVVVYDNYQYLYKAAVVVYDNYQYLHKAALASWEECSQI